MTSGSYGANASILPGLSAKAITGMRAACAAWISVVFGHLVITESSEDRADGTVDIEDRASAFGEQSAQQRTCCRIPLADQGLRGPIPVAPGHAGS